MDLNKEELKSLIKETVKEALEEYFPKTSKQTTEADLKQNYQVIFDEAMAKVARGEMTQEEAGNVIAQAHQKLTSPKNYTEQDFTTQFEQFKSAVSDWDKEMENFAENSGEPTEDMLQRMKNRTDSANSEAKKALELKRMNDEAAKAKAEMSLKEMKDNLSGK
jgi:hypothetical protein